MLKHMWAVGVMVLCVALAGCGDGGSSDTQADAHKPLEGKVASKASQLVGTWFRDSAGDYVGFEFMKENKVLVTHELSAAFGGAGSGKMMTYDVLDGGRLSLTAPNGETIIYTAVISGGMMLSGVASQRLRKLETGKTLQIALKEESEARAKAYKERVAALTGYLQQKELVIAVTDAGATGPVPVALNIQQNTGQYFSANAYHNDASPHMDQLTGQLSLNERQNTAQIQINFGPQIQPAPTGRTGGGNIVLDVTGDGKNLRIAGKVRYGNSGTEYEMVLMPDAKLHKEIVGRFNAELARIENLKKPLIKALNEYALLEGTSASENQNQAKPNPTRIVLIRDAAGNYTGETAMVNSSNGQPMAIPGTKAQITLINDKPLLFIDAYNRQYQLSLDSAGKLTGGWFYQQNPNGYGAEFNLSETSDLATYKTRIEAKHKRLLSLSPSTPLIGWITNRPNNREIPWIPVTIALGNPDASGVMTGTMSYPTVKMIVDIKGTVVDTLAGPQLQVRFGNLREAGTQHAQSASDSLRNQMWVYRLADEDTGSGTVKITDGVQTLTQLTNEYKSELYRKLTDALLAGLKVRTRGPYVNDPTHWATFVLNIDPATRKISGSAIEGSPHMFKTGAAVAGELKDYSGFPYLEVQINEPPVPNKPAAFRYTFFCDLCIYPLGDEWLIVSGYYPHTNAKSRQYLDMAQVK